MSAPSIKKWPADKVERRKVSDLVPYARNSRTHSAAQIDAIAASISEWGWTIPVLIDADDGIIAGHGRIMAAQKLGIVDVPCMVADGWSEAQKRAYVIADNRLPELAEWDNDMLALEFEELSDLDFDIDLTGFDEDEVERILADNPKAREKTEILKPITYTRVLLSIPNSVNIEEVKELIDQIIDYGVEADYGGN